MRMWLFAGCICTGCSFTENFERFVGGSDAMAGPPSSEQPPPRSSVDGAVPNGGASLCSDPDPFRLLCSDFGQAPLERGWELLIGSDTSSTAALDSQVFRSAPASARFSVPANGEHYVELYSSFPLSDRLEVAGWARVDVPSHEALGTTILVSVSVDGQADNVDLRLRSAGSDVAHLNGPSYDRYAFSREPPLQTVFRFVLTRDDVARTVSVAIDGVEEVVAAKLSGARPAATKLEVRAGIVNAVSPAAPVTVHMDDVTVRSL